MINEVAYCGLYCGNCPAHTGIIADLSRDLRKEFRKFRIDKLAEALSSISFFREYKKYPECYEVLGAMVKFRCNKGCRAGGSNPGCKIRKCCLKNKLAGCWECDEFESCDKLRFLEGPHGKAHLKNLKVLRQKGVDEFLKGEKLWYSEK